MHKPMKNTGSIMYESAYVYNVSPQKIPDTIKCHDFFELINVNTEIIINAGNKLQSKPHLDCIICHGQIVIKNAITTANLLPIYFLARIYARMIVITLNITAGSLATNTESPNILINILAIAA